MVWVLHHLLVDGVLVRPDPLGGEEEEEPAQQQQGEGQVEAALDREEVNHLRAVRAVRFPNLTQEGHINICDICRIDDDLMTFFSIASMRNPTRKGEPASPRAWVSIRCMASAEDRRAGVIT